MKGQAINFLLNKCNKWMHNKPWSLFWHTWRRTHGDADGIWVLRMWINHSSCFIPLLSSLNTRHFPKSLFLLDTLMHASTLEQRSANWSQALSKPCNSLARSDQFSLHIQLLKMSCYHLALKLRLCLLTLQQHSHFHLANTWQIYSGCSSVKTGPVGILGTWPWTEANSPTASAGCIKSNRTELRQIGFAFAWVSDLKLPDHWTLLHLSASHLPQFAANLIPCMLTFSLTKSSATLNI